MPGAASPVGSVTRGTTNTNRLRRVDRWIATLDSLRTAADPLVVDLGYGASGITALEMHRRLRDARPDVRVVGIEIEPGRVARARAQLAEWPDAAARERVSFVRGGFEVPLPGGERATVIRAFNVLRQYDESEVPAAWERMAARLASGGSVVEGTCDEIGRVASWVDVREDGPRSLTISLRLAGLELPSIVAERLPKALIHRNVPGERVHGLLALLDRSWVLSAPLGVYGPRQQWLGAVRRMRDAGVPVEAGPARWRLGELTVPWSEVQPGSA
ncbi:SAM-dependent methyltransferase [Clavibacter michiganensis]|uniref:class I SAM-dependent methyltransferase n=1 Tax=Clavibacter michiganensis TaxID=28447 RepID=UPI000CE7592E|nr:class I SAM-dependent methyltransferase [Clavibacter michiganensis]PPF56123.1 SAM-dependent methyltransferase [Clavibacter michiganensis]